MENKTMSTLKQAIEQSISRNKKVSVEYAGSCNQLVCDLLELIDTDQHDIDYAIKNDGTVDVWCFNPDLNDSSSVWRLRVTLTQDD